jgi:two-component system response regulator LytT
MDDKLNIYIVEANVFVAASLKRMIIAIGHNVCGISSTCEQALDELKWADANLVITEINLESNRNGIDLGKYIKTYLHIPVIYQSAVTDIKIIRDALANFPVAYLFKPVNQVKLDEAITTFINRRKNISPIKNLSLICPLQ